MTRKPIPDLGHEKLDGKRFYTQDFMQKEWDSIWKKTWQLVCREADLKYEGSFITHEIGKESFHFGNPVNGITRNTDSVTLNVNNQEQNFDAVQKLALIDD